MKSRHHRKHEENFSARTRAGLRTDLEWDSCGDSCSGKKRENVDGLSH
jgi:hypothetical protein